MKHITHTGYVCLPGKVIQWCNLHLKLWWLYLSAHLGLIQQQQLTPLFSFMYCSTCQQVQKLNTSYADSDRSKHGLQQVDEFKLSVFGPLLIRVLEPVTQFWYGSSFCRAEVACPGKVAPKSWCSQFSQYYKFRHMWMWIAHSPVVSLHE